MDLRNDQSSTQVDWAPASWFESQTIDQSVAAYFGHEKNGYQQFRHERLASVLNQIQGSLSLGAMLDVGCATGVLTERIRRQYNFNRAVGVDFVPEVLEFGGKLYPKIEFKEAALPELPFEDCEFDLIIASEVLYYLKPKAQAEAIKSFSRVLKKGGYLLVGSALGGPYFSVNAARELILDYFNNIDEDLINMSLYHKLVSPFYYSIRLNSLLMNNVSPGSEAMRKSYLRCKALLKSIPIYQLIQLAAKFSEPIISSRSLPRALNVLGKLNEPTNITILGRKK